MSIPLGQFVLDEVAGSGGAGIVWRGRHRRGGLPVAVKLLPPAADKHQLRAHKNEVQAVARLHHPHVVSILDTGFIDAAASIAASAEGQTLAEGSPWLAMELASGGDLHHCVAPAPWPVITDVLRTLLSALGHAHARGVIHKDLKPQNVLLCTSDDVRPGLKLTDFGLAISERSERLDGGTPLYMAPEQFDDESADLGPWTDLYALGCLAHWLATGAPPFVRKTWHELAVLHVNEPAPKLPTNVDAPPAFAEWLARLLEKDPAKRFRCAADADVALARIDPSRPAPPQDRLPDGLVKNLASGAGVPSALADAATVVKADTDRTEVLPPRTGPLQLTPVREGTGSVSQSQPPPVVGAAPPPSTWRAAAAALPDLRLVDAGLSLWGLRPVPLVGRDAERDALWDALLDVHRRRSPHLVVVRGPSGVGKSRLVEWIGHRALETGAARVLKATFDPLAGRSDGLVALVARTCGLAGLDDASAAHSQARRWLERWLPGVDITSDELCALAGKREGVFASGEERQTALVRLLAALARERPLLVWLDDVQHGKESLGLVARVLADAPELAALFVLTAVDELLDHDARTRIDELTRAQAARTVPLAPLDEASHDELCARLLGGHASGLADELRQRTEGNALFAVHVVGDWIQRGLLEVKDEGLALRPGTAAELPDELHALWDQRVASVVGDDAPDAPAEAHSTRVAIEIAAVLGSNVDLVEWDAAVKDARGSGSVLDDVVDALTGAGLARRTDAGFQFAHAMVRGTVERRAREAGRLAGHHACAAAALSSLWGTETPAAAARIGRHLLAAGAPSQALQPLFVAARAAVDEGDVLEASAVLADWEHAREQLALPDADLRVAPGLTLRAQVAHREGRHDEARALAARAASATKDPRARAAALRVEANANLVLGALAAAAQLFEEARAASARVDDKPGIGGALRGLGDVEYYRGDIEAAAARYKAVAEIFQAHGKKSDLATSLWSLGYVEMERGAYDEARRLFTEQKTVARAARDRLSEANAENALGELARRQKKLDDAEEHYKAAVRIASRNGLSRRWIFRLNQAHLRNVRGDHVGAGEVAAELVVSPAAAREPLVACSAWWIVATAAAARGDLVAFDRAAEAAIAAGDADVVEHDIVAVARLAADVVARVDGDRAARARAFCEAKERALTGVSAGK